MAISAEGKVADQSVYMSISTPDQPQEVAGESHTEQEHAKKSFSVLMPKLRLLANGEVYRTVPANDEDIASGVPVITGNRVAAPYQTDEGTRVLLVDVGSGTVYADISLAGADSVALRLSDQGLTIADSRGRLLVIDKHQGRLLRDLRI